MTLSKSERIGACVIASLCLLTILATALLRLRPAQPAAEAPQPVIIWQAPANSDSLTSNHKSYKNYKSYKNQSKNQSKNQPKKPSKPKPKPESAPPRDHLSEPIQRN